MRFVVGPVLAMAAALSGSDVLVDLPRSPALSDERPGSFAPLHDTVATGLPSVLPGPFPIAGLSVIDGDTVEATITIWLGQQVTTRVRLRGIDAPELSSNCAEERRLATAARNALHAMLKPGALLVEVGRDKYGGRVLAGLRTHDGRDVASLMTANGLARPYSGGRRAPWCETLSARR